MLRVGQNYLHNCLRIVSLKSNKEFNDVNNLGSKFYTPYFILVFKKGFIPNNAVVSSSQKFIKDTVLIHNQSQIAVDNTQSLHINKNKFKSNNGNIFLGIKVGRKVGKANLRNKIKRRIKHLVRIVFKKLKSNNYGIVFVPRKNLATAKFELLVNTVDKLLSAHYSL